MKQASIARPATSEEENLPGCSGSSGLDLTRGRSAMSATMPGGLWVRAQSQAPTSREPAGLSVREST